MLGESLWISRVTCSPADPSGEAIYRIDPDGHVSTFVNDAEGARSLAFGPDGQLYSCDDEGIVTYSSNGTKSLRVGR